MSQSQRACSSGTVSRVLPLDVRRRLFFVDVAWRIHWRRSRLRGTHARESGFVITGWVDVDGICAKSVCDHGMIGYGGFGSGTGIYDGANGAVFFLPRDGCVKDEHSTNPFSQLRWKKKGMEVRYLLGMIGRG